MRKCCIGLAAIAILVVVVRHHRDYQGYARCQDCGTAFQLRWGWPGLWGLPGQHRLDPCRFCGDGSLRKCTKEEAGWDDTIPMGQWNWG